MIPRHRAWTVALVATLTMTVSYIDRQTLAVLAPTVTKALHITETQYGWLQSAFAFAYLVATPIAGWWIDRIGARRGLVRSILVWSLVAAIHAVVPGFWILLGLRVALGLAEGPGFPGGAQTTQRVLPPEDRPRGFGVLFTGSSIGGMIAPPLASFLFGAFDSWRVAFLGTAIVGLLWIPLWIAVTAKREVRETLDAAPEQRATRTATVGEIVLHPNMLRGLAAIVAVAPITGFALTWGAKYVVRAFDLPQKSVGHYLWLPPLVFDLGTILFGDLAARQRRAPGAPPRLLFAIALVLATTIGLVPYAPTIWQTMIVFGIAMAGGGAIYALVTADLLSRVPRENVSFAGDTLACGQSIAHVIANPLIGASVDRTHSYAIAVTVLALWSIPGCVYWLVRRPI